MDLENLTKGRRKPELILNSEFEIKADIVIKALVLTQKIYLNYLITKTYSFKMGNNKKINFKSMETNIPGIFAAGDIVRGASLVVWAIRDGRDAATEIQKYLEQQKKKK